MVGKLADVPWFPPDNGLRLPLTIPGYAGDDKSAGWDELAGLSADGPAVG